MHRASRHFSVVTTLAVACALPPVSPAAEAPPVKSSISPVMVKPITAPAPLPKVGAPVARPVTVQPIAVQPITAPARSDVAITPLSKVPSTPVARIAPPTAVGEGTGSRAAIDIQKQSNKDAREDRALDSRVKPLESDAKSQKLGKDQENIDRGMKASAEKADRALRAADAELAMGAVSGAIQIGGGVVPLGETDDVETIVQKVLFAVDRENKSDLRDQLKEVRAANAAKKDLREQGPGTPDTRRARLEAAVDQIRSKKETLGARSQDVQEARKLVREHRENSDKLDARIKELDKRIDQLKDQADKLDKVAQKIEHLLPDIMGAAGTDQGSKPGGPGARAGDDTKAGGTVAVGPAKPAIADTKPKLTARPCTPLNPC